MRRLRLLGVLFLFAGAGAGAAVGAGAGTVSAQSLHDFSVSDIHGSPQSLRQYEGDVVLLVNTASLCGFTYQYEGLQRLHEQFHDRGFTVLGFPSDNFANQELESEAEILGFCESTFGVTFPLFSRTTVRSGLPGQRIDPLFQWLTTVGPQPGPVTWNFNKFLIGKDGRLLARFDTPVEPEDPRIIRAIESALAQ